VIEWVEQLTRNEFEPHYEPTVRTYSSTAGVDDDIRQRQVEH